MKNTLRLLATLALVVVAGMSLKLMNDTTSIRADLAKMDTARQAETVAAEFIQTAASFTAEKDFCGRFQAGLCEIVTFRPYPNLGSHAALWVALDAILTLNADNALPPAARRQMTRSLSDLSAALAAHGALPLINQGTSTPGQLFALDLYKAILAEAAVCRAVPAAGPCHNDLPVPVVSALNTLVTLTLADDTGLLRNHRSALDLVQSSL